MDLAFSNVIEDKRFCTQDIHAFFEKGLIARPLPRTMGAEGASGPHGKRIAGSLSEDAGVQL